MTEQNRTDAEPGQGHLLKMFVKADLLLEVFMLLQEKLRPSVVHSRATLVGPETETEKKM